MGTVTEIAAALEKLSRREQEEFAEWYERRLASGGPDASVDEAWSAEARRRLEEIDSGKVKAIPGDEVMARMRKIIGR
jgi:putative addiction module component (TIGR02574 family)